jgi:hypothetical protein
MAPHRSSACRFGLKRDRRKLHIEPLHLPPEDSRASKYQSETSLGVKQDKGKDKDKNKDKDKGTSAAVANSLVASSSVIASGSSRVGSSTSALARNVQKISIHGNDSSRHAPAISAGTTKALCASMLPSASMKNKHPKDLDF